MKADPTIYIIVASSGDHEEANRWIVAAYRDHGRAGEHARLATEAAIAVSEHATRVEYQANKLYPGDDDQSAEAWLKMFDKAKRIRGRGTLYDPEAFSKNRDVPSYSIELLPLRQDLPQPRRQKARTR